MPGVMGVSWSCPCGRTFRWQNTGPEAWLACPDCNREHVRPFVCGACWWSGNVEDLGDTPDEGRNCPECGGANVFAHGSTHHEVAAQGALAMAAVEAGGELTDKMLQGIIDTAYEEGKPKAEDKGDELKAERAALAGREVTGFSEGVEHGDGTAIFAVEFGELILVFKGPTVLALDVPGCELSAVQAAEVEAAGSDPNRESGGIILKVQAELLHGRELDDLAMIENGMRLAFEGGAVLELRGFLAHAVGYPSKARPELN